MRTGKLWPGATSRLGTATDAFPPGVASCAATINVIPRIFREPAFRKESDMCTSTTIAPPRGVAPDSSTFVETCSTGESSGKLIWIELFGSSFVSCPQSAMAPAKINPAALLRINIVDGDVTCFAVHIAGAHGVAARQVIHIARIACARTQHHDGLIACL